MKTNYEKQAMDFLEKTGCKMTITYKENRKYFPNDKETRDVYDIKIEQGTTLTKQFIYKDSSGIPMNLTGYTARMQIRSSVSSARILLELTTENNKLVLGGSSGQIQMIFSEADTSVLSRGGVYDLELVQGPADYDPNAVDAPKVTRLLKGEILLSKGVTRRVG